MKKTLLTLFAGVLIAGSASAQCTPDPQYANASGNFFPDSADFIMNDYAVAGSAYSAQIDIKTISDTLVDNPINPAQQITAYIDAFRIASVDYAGLQNFTYSGGGTTYEATDPRPDFGGTTVAETWFNTYGTANDPTTLSIVQGCLSITADAAAVTAAAPATGFTDYEVTVNVDARIAGTDPDISLFVNNGSWLSDLSALGLGPLTVDGYVIRVYAEDPNSITELLNTNVFEVHQSYPNPAANEATITFTNPRVEEVELKVFNMLGAMVHNEKIVSEAGVNDIKLNTGRMSSGMYIYTVSNGAKTFTKKMTVK